MASAERVATGERHNLTISEAHATKHLSKMRCTLHGPSGNKTQTFQIRFLGKTASLKSGGTFIEKVFPWPRHGEGDDVVFTCLASGKRPFGGTAP